MAYNVGMEDPQNWPFSVRYTASPYRKSKFPVDNGMNSSGGAGGIMETNTSNIPSYNQHHHQPLHHQHHWTPQPSGLPLSYSNTNNIPATSHSPALHASLQPHQHEYHNGSNFLNNFNPGHQNYPGSVNHTPSQQVYPPLYYQQHQQYQQYCFLQQHHQLQQQYHQSAAHSNHSIQNGDHPYGLPVPQQPHPNFQNTQFFVRHPPKSQKGRFQFLPALPPNDSKQVDGVLLDEGYIEDLKQRGGSTLPTNPQNPFNGASLIVNNITGSLEYDPYSYVYDSNVHEESLPFSGSSILERLQREALSSGKKSSVVSTSSSSSGTTMPNMTQALQPGSHNGNGHQSENEYEEIRDVARYMAEIKEEKEKVTNEPTFKPRAFHFKSFSSTNDLRAEVVSVQQGHDRVLDQLNLEVENLLIRSTTEEIETENNRKLSELIFLQQQHGYSNMAFSNQYGNGNGSSSRTALVTCHQQSQSMDSCLKGKGSPGQGGPLFEGFRTKGSIKNNGHPPSSTLNSHSHKKSKSETCAGCCNTMDNGSGPSSMTMTSVDRKKKLDRSITLGNPGQESNKCLGSHQQFMASLKKKIPVDKEEKANIKASKARHHRSYSFIPHWKIRDQLMRLPFLRQNSDKLKKTESCSLSSAAAAGTNSISVSAQQVPGHLPNNKPESNFSSSLIKKRGKDKVTNGSVCCNNMTMAAIKARSSSMDELRATGAEEHWYSADSDTEPDSLTALPLPLPLPDLSRGHGVLSMTSSLTSLGLSNHLTMSSTAPAPSPQENGSRLDVGNGIQDNIPKAPKFRRGSGIKDKWRESWSQSKTLSKTNMEEDNRLLRWFSLRKNQGGAQTENSAVMNNRNSTLPLLSEEDLKRISFMEDEEGYWPRRTVLPPTLPVPPPNLTSEQITRRHIVAAIVHSENNYVAALQRLVNEYKKPLECSHPAMLSHSKISTVFHRVPEILQCHSLFRIALAEYIRKWDADEKIGDVFVASFSKSLVLDVYSEFINNFGQAMETAKSEARRKSAFAEFLKVKQMTAHDRLSLFGLMVKPVQRFPQFILLLQDLLKHTPKDHHDRMSLQLALTQLESLAAMLNERKRESEQYQAFRETIKSIGGGKFVLLRSVADDPNRILLRQDIVTQLEFDSNGGTVAKSKTRKLLLLNDMLLCVTASGTGSASSSERGSTSHYRSTSGVTTNSSVVNMDSNQNHTTTSGKVEKSVFKWSHPVRDVEVEDISISPTMSRFVHSVNGQSMSSLHNHRQKGSSATLPVPDEETQQSVALLEEMQSLMYDYEVLSRILTLVTSLKSAYEGLTEASVKELMLEIQHQIRCRDEQISYFDSSCLTLLLGTGHNREKVVFQMQSPAARNEWIEELRLAQLALDPNNSPAWDIPAESPYPHHKLPLFVRALPLARSPHLSTVKCGCFFTHTFVSPTGRSKILDYLWVSCTDGISSHVTAFRSQQNSLKEVSAFDLVEEKINDLLFVSGHVWVATDSRKIMVLDPADPEKGNLCHYLLSDSVLKLTLFGDVIYAGLSDGNLAVFTQIHNPKKIEPEVLIKLGTDPVPAVFGSRDHVYASCGNAVVTIDAKTHTIERNVVLTHHNGPITHMACSGVGLWISTQDSGTVCLYHLESLQHLQDVSIAPSVFRTVRDSYRRQKGCHVTCLSAHKGWLWIGTNLGVVLTIPLPRLEGVPIISTGKANVSYHGYNGPVTFLMPLFKSPPPALASAATSNRQASKTLTDTPVKPVNPPLLETPVKSNTIPEEDLTDKFRTPKNSISFEEKDSTLTNSLTESRSPSLSNNSSFNSSKGATPSKGSPLQSLASGLSGSRDGSGSEQALSSATGLSGLNKTLVILRKKHSRDNIFNRNCKTLPRGGPAVHSSLRFSIDSDVYGLYGNLINVRGLEDEGRFVDPLYDALRRSDPELVALDSKISTLDRRLKMRMSRPRSLDLSNWSVDSKISASSDESVGLGSSRSSQATDSSAPTPVGHPPSTPVLALNGSADPSVLSMDAGPVSTSTPVTGTTKKTVSRTKGKSKSHQERTVIVAVGGRGYVNMRAQPFQDHFQPDAKLCTNLTIWQMKT